MKKYIRTPMHLYELPKEQIDEFKRQIVANYVKNAIYEYMQKNGETPHHIEIFEKTRETYGYEIDILREPKTGMYKYRGDLISYVRLCEIISECRLKDYEIEVY